MTQCDKLCDAYILRETNVKVLSPMSQSLSPDCTPLKKTYDTCFNDWFAGYLEPAVSAFSSTEARTKFSEEKAKEFDQKCGKIWEDYKSCVQVCNEKFLIIWNFGDKLSSPFFSRIGSSEGQRSR